MDLFNRDKISELENKLTETKEEFNDYYSKSVDDFNKLESMIMREQGLTSSSISKLYSDYSKIGDPYDHNIYVRKSIDKIAGSISGAPFSIVDLNDKELPANNPATRLFNYISQYDTPSDFLFEIVRNLYRFGKAHVHLSEEKRVGTKLPQVLDVLPSNKISAKTSNGILLYWEYKEGGRTIRYQPEDILFIRFKHPEKLFDGLAPGSSAVKEILQDFFAQMYNIKYFQQGAQGKGVWRAKDGFDLSPQQQREAQFAADQTYNKGLESAHKEHIVKRDLEWIRTSDSQKDMEFQALLDKMRDRVLVVYEIPKVLFASSESTFANLEEAKKMFWTQTLQPIMKKIEDAFNTNLFEALGIPYRLTFNRDEIPELQDDVSSKFDSAKKLYDMNVPLSVINEVLGLDLPEWEGMDERPQTPQPQFFDAEGIVKDAIKQSHIEEEKRIVTDETLIKMEYQKSLETMLTYERQLNNNIVAFFKDKYKEIEEFMKEDEVKSVNKGLVDPDWIDRFIRWIKDKDWRQEFFDRIKDQIHGTYERGRYRTYWGLGTDFSQSDLKASTWLANRSLLLKDSPEEVKSILIKHLQSNAFTMDEIAKEIDKKWNDAAKHKSKLVARTETTAAFNGGRVEGMKELGIKKKQWVNSGDGSVRPTHQISEVVHVDEKFSNGLMYPGDGSMGAGEVCNCRCSITSYLE